MSPEKDAGQQFTRIGNLIASVDGIDFMFEVCLLRHKFWLVEVLKQRELWLSYQTCTIVVKKSNYPGSYSLQTSKT